ncbi:MAG: amidohydrolase family protein [Verrucomicrobiota bacterium]
MKNRTLLLSTGVPLFVLAAIMMLVAADEGTGENTPSVQAFVGAHLIPITGDPIDDGVLVIENGTISAIGKSGDVVIPPEAEEIDASGKVIMPGLICTHSHIGQVSGADYSAPIQPEVRVIDSINVRHNSFKKARSGGLTTVNIMPGSGHLLSGQTIYLKLRDGGSIEDLVIETDTGGVAGGIKMANGTNSKRGHPFPGTRAKSVSMVREHFIKALEYRKKLELAGDDASKAPPRDLAMEALLEVLDQKRVVHHHTHRHDDILTVLRLKEEFDFRVVLHHVSEAWKVADQIASAKVPCSLILLDSPGGKLEAADIAWENGAALERVGVLTAFHTDDPINDSRWFLRSAAFSVRAGMSRSAALYGMTMAGAVMLDLEDRIGSLSVGKDADFVILSGDPLSVYTRVEETWVEGRKVFDLEDPDDRLWATGGWGAGAARVSNMCCFDNPQK